MDYGISHPGSRVVYRRSRLEAEKQALEQRIDKIQSELNRLQERSPDDVEAMDVPFQDDAESHKLDDFIEGAFATLVSIGAILSIAFLIL